MFTTVFPNLAECVVGSHSCETIDSHDLTEQDHIVTIPELLSLYQGHLDDLFVKFNNKLLYESASGGVFIDQLNEKEVADYEARKAQVAAKEAELNKERELFDQFKRALAQSALTPTVPMSTPLVPASSTGDSVSQ